MCFCLQIDHTWLAIVSMPPHCMPCWQCHFACLGDLVWAHIAINCCTIAALRPARGNSVHFVFLKAHFHCASPIATLGGWNLVSWLLFGRSQSEEGGHICSQSVAGLPMRRSSQLTMPTDEDTVSVCNGLCQRMPRSTARLCPELCNPKVDAAIKASEAAAIACHGDKVQGQTSVMTSLVAVCMRSVVMVMVFSATATMHSSTLMRLAMADSCGLSCSCHCWCN